MENFDETKYTGNGALSNATTGSHCLDYWSKSGTYTNRPQEAVDTDMAKIFGEDVNSAVKIVFGTRLITRKTEDLDTQTGYGRKDEFYKSVVWMHRNVPDLLYRNIHLIPVFGCWRDFLTEPLIDVLDTQKVYELFRDNLNNQLLLKYLPLMRSEKRTDRSNKRIRWAAGFCKILKISPKEYRKLKSGGAAHVWQRQMSANEWDKINFNGIPGRAMSKHVSLKGKDKKNVFERHNQVERLTDWLVSQKSVKFNGYPYELTRNALKSTSLVETLVCEKQFETLLEPFKNHSLGNVLCAVDTSGSMSWTTVNGATALDVCLSLGLIFSSLNVGCFQNVVCSFGSVSRLIELNGNFTERLRQLSRLGAMGNTNFQSVIDVLVDYRTKHPDMPLDQYPETILVVSDMAMDIPNDASKTNYQSAMMRLKEVDLGSVKIIWWNVNGKTNDFPATMDDPGTYLIGGFDPMNLMSLLGVKENQADSKSKGIEESIQDKSKATPMEGMRNFLSQPIFSLLKV